MVHATLTQGALGLYLPRPAPTAQEELTLGQREIGRPTTVARVRSQGRSAVEGLAETERAEAVSCDRREVRQADLRGPGASPVAERQETR